MYFRVLYFLQFYVIPDIYMVFLAIRAPYPLDPLPPPLWQGMPALFYNIHATIVIYSQWYKLVYQFNVRWSSFILDNYREIPWLMEWGGSTVCIYPVIWLWTTLYCLIVHKYHKFISIYHTSHIINSMTHIMSHKCNLSISIHCTWHKNPYQILK